MKRVLLLSIGSESGYTVIKSLKKNGFFLVGCNCFPKKWIYNASLVDIFYETPMVCDKGFLTALSNIIEKEHIDYVIPLTDIDVDWLSANWDLQYEWGCIFCQSSKETISICRNKKKFSDYCIKGMVAKPIPTISISELINTQKFPYICKPIGGRSSEGLLFINDRDDFQYYKKVLKTDYIIQPYIEGSIYCADIVRHPKTKNVVVVVREELLRTHKGSGLSVKMLRDEDIEDSCKKLSECLNIFGCVNFEFIRTKEDELYVLECNPRFSGGIGFTYATGYDIVKNHMIIFDKSNQDIENFEISKETYMEKEYEIHILKG